MSTHTTPTVPLTAAAIVMDLGASPRQTATVSHLIEQAHREAAELQAMATKLIATLSSGDGNAILGLAMEHTHHAGYSNSIHTAAAEITAILAKLDGVVTAVAS